MRQSMMTSPAFSPVPSFQARMKFPAGLKRPARFEAASRRRFKDAGFFVRA